MQAREKNCLGIKLKWQFFDSWQVLLSISHLEMIIPSADTLYSCHINIAKVGQQTQAMPHLNRNHFCLIRNWSDKLHCNEAGRTYWWCFRTSEWCICCPCSSPWSWRVGPSPPPWQKLRPSCRWCVSSGRAEGLCGCSVTQLEAAQADDCTHISLWLFICSVMNALIYLLIHQRAGEAARSPFFLQLDESGEGLVQLGKHADSMAACVFAQWVDESMLFYNKMAAPPHPPTHSPAPFLLMNLSSSHTQLASFRFISIEFLKLVWHLPFYQGLLTVFVHFSFRSVCLFPRPITTRSSVASIIRCRNSRMSSIEPLPVRLLWRLRRTFWEATSAYMWAPCKYCLLHLGSPAAPQTQAA